MSKTLFTYITLFIVATLSSLLLLIDEPTVLAQGPPEIQWQSAYQLQNLDAQTATVSLTYVSTDSTIGDLTGHIQIAGNSSKTIFPLLGLTPTTTSDGINNPPATFLGSLVVSSDRQIDAILNTQTRTDYSPFYGASTKGFSAGTTSVSLPLIVCNNSGFDTFFSVQNTGSSNATVSVSYTPASHGTAATDSGIVIRPNAAKYFDQRNGTTTGTKACGAGLGEKFIGSAIVTSDQPVVASALFLGTGNLKALQGYNGFASGSESINLPLIMSHNSAVLDLYTAIQVQNTGTNTTTVTVTFSQGNLDTAPTAETFTLAGRASQTFIQLGGISSVSPNNNWDTIAANGYVGSATITQTGNEPLVAIVNQNSNVEPRSLGSTYEGFGPNDAATTLNVPLIAANNNGYQTGIQIQALQASTQITVTYSANTVTSNPQSPQNDVFTIATAGESKTLIQANNVPSVSGVNNWTAIGQYIGSAIITADKPVVAIINFTRNETTIGDVYFTYTTK